MKQLLFMLSFLISFGINGQISQDGLLAYYPFDGDTMDSGPNNYNGENYGGQFGEDENGNANSSLILNGVDQFIDLSVFADEFRDNLSDLSIYFKVKFDQYQSDQTILSLSNQGESLETNVFEFEYENDQIQLETEIGNNAINFELELESPDDILDGEWHEILITLNGDSLSYCRNGQTLYNGIYQPAETTVNNLFLGCYNGTGANACCFFGGNIDELQFYNRVLNKEEIIVETTNLTDRLSIETYPNPSIGTLTVDIEGNLSDFTISILDVYGRLLKSEKYFNQHKIIVTLPEPKGIYYLQLLSSNGEIMTRSLLKQ